MSNDTELKTYGSTGAGSEEDGKIKPKLKYPKSVFFIISNEFCERFSYYGMRTILSLYLESKLKYSEEDSTRIYHTFVMLCYFFPIIGAIVADSYLGKFKTIFYLSIVYAIGSVTISVSSSGLGPLGKSEHLFSLFGLLLIAMGTGGIKPCVSSFGGDQFVLPEQEKQLQQFFSVFYFSINAGSLISTFLTPELREDVACLDQDTCYPLAFGVPAVLMVVSLIIFVCGRFMYKMKKPSGNVIVDITKCSAYALKKKITTKGGHYEHWLDYAQDKYNRKLIDDTKIVMSLILLFSPTILFWSLYEQQGTSWIFQAKRMNGRIGGYTIKPDQMQVLNPILILAFIPLFEWVVYPILSKLHLVRTPLQKLVIGGLMVSVAFIVAAFVEQKIQPTYEILPQEGEAQLRIINGYNCPANVDLVNIDGNPHKIEKLGILQLRNLQAKGTQDIGVTVNILKSECSQLKSDLQYKGTISITEQESVSYLISNKLGSESGILFSRLGKYDTIRKSDKGEALIRIAYQVDKNSKLELAADSKLSFDLSVSDHVTDLQSAEPGSYKLNLNSKEIGEVPIEFGGVYTILITAENTTTEFNIYEISPPSTVHILWQLPQICILTAAEIMFSITGLEFSYSQAPKSMKSVISSLWLLTDSIGNMFVVGLSTIFERQSRVVQFLIYAGLMVLVMAVFAILAWRYRYVTPDNDEDEEESNGQDNPAYKTED